MNTEKILKIRHFRELKVFLRLSDFLFYESDNPAETRLELTG